MAHFTSGNDKLKYTGKANDARVYAFDLPAKKTCPRANECKAYCYANVGRYTLPSMVKHAAENLEWTKSDNFVNEAISEISELNRGAAKAGKRLVIRLHSSGDFYSAKYAEDWSRIAEAFISDHNVFFYAYSKSWAIFRGFGVGGTVDGCYLNLFIIPSTGGKDDHLIGPRPHARTVPVGFIPTGFDVLGDKDDLKNVMAISSGRNVCLEAHGARKSRVILATV